MFIIKNYVAPSLIHGIGVFAGEDVKDGDPIWRFAADLDLVVPFTAIQAAPIAFQDYMEMYAYISPQKKGGMVLSCDHAKFLNHSENPNTHIEGETTYARGDIAKGDEITCDYQLCVADWSGEF